MEVARQRKTATRRVLILGTVFLLAVVMVGIMSRRYATDHKAPEEVTFQEFAPTYLPEGLVIKNKTSETRYTPASDPKRTTVLNLTLNDGSFIYVSKDMRHFRYSCLQGSIINEICSVAQTPYGQKYVLITTTVPHQNTSQSLEWVRGGSDIRMHLETPATGPYTQAELAKIVDSFKPVKYQNLPARFIDDSVI